jgi:ubiquitin
MQKIQKNSEQIASKEKNDDKDPDLKIVLN